MIRPVATELALFLAPFVLYALFLWATRAVVFDQQSWPWNRLAWLTIVALLLMIGSFIGLAQWSGVPTGQTYVPAHVDKDGNLVPAQTK